MFVTQLSAAGTTLAPDHLRQKAVAVVLAVAMTVVAIELVRKRKLREEYSILWIVTGLTLLALAVFDDLLLWFQRLIGAAEASSALFFGGLVFLIVVALQVSVRLSRLTFRNKSLTQRVALLERELRDLQQRMDEHDSEHDAEHDPDGEESRSSSTRVAATYSETTARS
jgi:hypothetical protein